MAVFLSLVVVLCTLGGTASVSAQNTPPPKEYGTYKNLFTTKNPLSTTGNSFLIQDLVSKKITGLKLNINLDLNVSSGKKAEWYWDFVAEKTSVFNTPNDSEAFLVRLCPKTVPNKCWVNTISGGLDSAGRDKNTGLFQKENGSFVSSISITNLDFFNSSSTGGIKNGRTYSYERITTEGKNEGDTSTVSSVPFIPGGEYVATLWYCAGPNTAGEPDGTKAYNYIDSSTDYATDDTIARFDGLCDGVITGSTTYFRIGEPLTLKISEDQQALAGQINTTAAAKNSTAESSDTNLPACSFGVIGESRIVGCIAQGVYYAIYWPLAWVAGFFGKLFDFFLGYTLSDESYRFEFVTTAWKVIRDVSNIFFIVILVWTGFSTVFGISKVSMRQVIPTIIINALIINFSLFGTRLLVDMSNVVARVFYGQIHVCINTECTPVDGGSPYKTNGTGGYKPISEAIVASFNPQKIFSEKYIVAPTYSTTEDLTKASFNSTQTDSTISKGTTLSANTYAGYFIVVCLFAAAIMFFVMKMFWTMALMFLGRVVGIYISMIFSPFAFLSRGNVPLIGKVGFLGWDDWLKDISDYAMQAPIFVFFLYVIYSFMQKQGQFVSESILNQGADSGLLEGVLSVTIPMGIIYFFISYGVNISKKYSGKIGGMIQSTVDGFVGGAGGVVGAGVGLATGGAAFLGRNVIGRSVQKFGNSKTGNKVTVDGKEVDETVAMRYATNAPSSKSARLMNNFINKSQTGTWDTRNTKLGTNLSSGFNKIGAIAGISLKDKLSSGVGLGKDKALGKGSEPGGIMKIDKAREKARKEANDAKINYDHITDDKQVKVIWDEHKKNRINKIATDQWENAFDVDDIAENSTENFAFKSKIAELETDLANLKTSGAAPSIIALKEKRIAELKLDQESTLSAQKVSLTGIKTGDKDRFENLKKEAVSNIKNNGDFKTSSAYKKIEKKEEDRLKKYGDIKDGKKLTAAMRGEYAHELREDSWWMKRGKDGKEFENVYIKGAAQAAVGAALMAFLPGLGTLMGAAMIGGAARGLVDHVGNIHQGSSGSSISGVTKAQGTGSKLGKLEKNVSSAADKLIEAINVHNKNENKPLITSLENVDEKTIEEGLAGYEIHLENEMAKNGITNVERKVLERKKKGIQNIQKNYETAQEALDKHLAELKAAQDKKDEKS